jgi:para-nitrobenzyl esterase
MNSPLAPSDDSWVTVRTNQGLVRGRRAASACAFLGIPYAAPPVGPLRWRPPQAAARWEGVRDALQFGADFPQAPLYPLRGAGQGEDALHLNVWTPVADPAARLPVLVWIHGGGFSAGSGSEPQNDGARLAAEGAVVVTLNYRIGLYGFLAHPALSRESAEGVCGNYGLLDQLAALAWVRENIAAFGGDPARVTAFGYSAGSASLSLLLTSPLARGAFDQAILQSPGAGRPLAPLKMAEDAGRVLGEGLAALRALDAQQILARTSLLSPRVRGLTTPRVLRPIQDGWVVPQDERAALAAGRIHPMPLLVGSNADEGSLLTRAWPCDTLAAWQEQVDLNFGAAASQAAKLYAAAGEQEARAKVAEMFADTQFNYGTRLLARAMAQREPRTWRYLFAHRPAGQADGPHHGDEVAYVFGTLAESASEEDRQLSDRMRKAWVRFAAAGDPNGAGLPRWDAFRAAEDNHLVLSASTQGGAAWRAAQLDFLERFYAK